MMCFQIQISISIFITICYLNYDFIVKCVDIDEKPYRIMLIIFKLLFH